MQRGFTLIETIVVISVSAMVMLEVSTSILAIYRANNYSFQEASALAEAQHGLDAAVSNIRESTYGEDGSYPLVSIGDTDLIFFSDIDSDNQVERTHYRLTGTTLERGLIQPTGSPLSYTTTEVFTPIAQYVRNASSSTPVFTYYDATGTAIPATSSISSVRAISVKLIIDVDPKLSPQQITVASTASLRNL